jgi:Tfp pilus assembly protein PilF
MEQGMKRAGAEWLSTVLIFDPTHREAHLALARYYEETGEKAIAAKHRQQAGE